MRKRHRGVFGYFALQFAREDLTGLVTDPNDPSFDIAEVENIARIQATVGAHAAASPFLRVDGSNQMQNGITFVNGVQLNMNADRLEIDAPGGIDFETDVRAENLSATDINATTLETYTATVSNELLVDDPDGVKGTGFDRLDQSADIVRIDGDVVRLSQSIDANTAAIDLNLLNIASNAADTASLQNDAQGNRDRINANSLLIASNSQNIDDMGEQVGLLRDDLTTLSDVSVCSPTSVVANAAAHADNPGYIYNSGCDCHWRQSTCSTTRNSCPPSEVATGPDSRRGRGTGNSITYNYQTRDSYTLQCTDNTASIYEQCHVTITETGCENQH